MALLTRLMSSLLSVYRNYTLQEVHVVVYVSIAMRCCTDLFGDALQFLADVVVVCRSLHLQYKTLIVWCAC